MVVINEVVIIDLDCDFPIMNSTRPPNTTMENFKPLSKDVVFQAQVSLSAEQTVC